MKISQSGEDPVRTERAAETETGLPCAAVALSTLSSPLASWLLFERLKKKMVRNVGDLLCQRESYALSVEAQVERCEGPSEKGLYRLFLSDTVIFPEGGGQPADRGSLTVEADGRQLQILDAQREGLECVHIVDCPLSAGSLVKVKVDWKRRFDHMQQHSGF